MLWLCCLPAYGHHVKVDTTNGSSHHRSLFPLMMILAMLVIYKWSKLALVALGTRLDAWHTTMCVCVLNGMLTKRDH